MKIRRILSMVVVTFGILSILSMSAYARVKGLRVTRIHENGVLDLDNGRKIELAGVDIPTETLRLLPALLSGSEIEMEFEMIASTRTEAGVSAAYIYVNTQEIDVPTLAGAKPEEKHVMVNELLLSMGAAKVREKDSFTHKENFKEIQAVAKAAGHGIWSYSEAATLSMFQET